MTETKVTERAPTDVYRIGIGDVLLINLKNSAHGSGFYTVRENGQIDYPLAGQPVTTANRTTDEVAAVLRSSIRLYTNPQVEVKVQYYLSRSFSVEGLVDNPGEKVLRRDAMPIFAIRAESEVRRQANRVKITRAMSGSTEEYSLADAGTDNILVAAGDRVEFFEVRRVETLHYTFSGVKKPLVAGTRLSEALAAALGAASQPRYAVIRRVGENGVTTISEYDIKSIKKGRVIDPLLNSGDVIDVKN